MLFLKEDKSVCFRWDA